MIKRKYLITVLIAFAVALMLVPSTRASIGLPDYDSGWRSINQGQELTLTHNLGTTEVLVYVIGNDTTYGHGIHHMHYGATTEAIGLYWLKLENTTISIKRTSNDLGWYQVRVMIWKIASLGVGGLWIPVDNFSLLAPYIALTSTIILAVSISVAYIKHRKKQ